MLREKDLPLGLDKGNQDYLPYGYEYHLAMLEL